MTLVFVRSRPARNSGAAAERGAQLSVRLGIALDGREHTGDGRLPGGGHGLLVMPRGLVVIGQSHPVDGGQRQIGVGLPRRRAGLPLVRTARAVLVDEAVKGLEEGLGGGVVGRAAQPVEQIVRPGVERGGERARRRAPSDPAPRTRTDGAAESTPPMPATSVMARVGSPIAVHTLWMTPSGHRRAVGDVQVLREHPAQLGRVAAEAGDELGVGQVVEGRARRPELGHPALVGFEVRQLRGREDPSERGLDRVGLGRILVARAPARRAARPPSRPRASSPSAQGSGPACARRGSG